MAEAVVKERETEKVKPFVVTECASSDQWAKMAEAVAKEQESEKVKPICNSANPTQMAADVAKERENEEVKPLHKTVKPGQMAEAVAKERETKKIKPVDPRYVAIQVKSQDGVNTFFKIRRDTELKRLLIAYCQKRSVDYLSTRFLINGDRFNHDTCADDIELEDEIEIDAMIEALGGGEPSFAWISAN